MPELPLATDRKLELTGPPRVNELLCEALGEVCVEFRCEVDQREKAPPVLYGVVAG